MTLTRQPYIMQPGGDGKVDLGMACSFFFGCQFWERTNWSLTSQIYVNYIYTHNMTAIAGGFKTVFCFSQFFTFLFRKMT